MPESGSPPPSEAPHGLTVDQVVAANIRKLREARQMTRDDLAQQITDLGGEDVSRWRVIDLEGKRSPDTPPRSATWVELIQLMIVLEVDLPELVLPDDQAAVAPPAAPHIEITDTETGELLGGIFLGAMNRESMAQEIFGLPLAWVERREAISRETIPADYIEEREEASRQRAETMERLVEALEGEKGQQLLDGLLAAIDDYEPEGDS